MRTLHVSAAVWAVVFAIVSSSAVMAQGTGTIAGTVTDINHGVLPGAKIAVAPTNLTAVSDSLGGFTLNGVAPGVYDLTISYVGFAPFTSTVTVVAGQQANVNAVLQVASESQSVLVTAPRAHGEAELINVEQTTPQIIDHLPLDVITSLPILNLADATNHVPGVTVERDEGEPKYVQVRGTEPRLTNMTVDGVQLASPEGGVRQIKMDVIPADIVDAVQIYKTLDASQWADAIGGTVNVVTRTAGTKPTGSLYFAQGYTPLHPWPRRPGRADLRNHRGHFP